MIDFINWYKIGENRLVGCNYFKKMQIEIAKNYCFNNDIPIRDIYKDNNYILLLKNVNRRNFIKFFFPPSNKFELKNLNISLEGMYSVSHWKDNQKIIEYLDKINFNYKDTLLVDATANVGGVTIYMAKYFKEVIGIELDGLNYNMLRNNVKLYELKNVSLLFGNSIELLPKIIIKNKTKNKVVFFDPPWGGLNYRENKEIDLFLGDLNLYEIVDFIIQNVNLILIKAPHNYNIQRFREVVKYKIDIIQLKKYQVIVVSNEFIGE